MEVVFEVIPHKRLNGQTPVFNAIFSFKEVSNDLSDKVLAHIKKLEHKSNHSGLSIEKIDDKLWCLRVRHSNNHVRIFFTFLSNSKIILLNGFIKKTNNIPINELTMARKLLKEMSYA